MNKKILTHPELYEESLRLEELIEEYKDNNDSKLEKTLLEIIPIYDGLNYCEEDEYLENINEVYNDLLNIYLKNNDENKVIWCLDKLLDNYDLLINRDIGNNDLINKHASELNNMISKYDDYLKHIDIFKDYPRLKQYIKG